MRRRSLEVYACSGDIKVVQYSTGKSELTGRMRMSCDWPVRGDLRRSMNKLGMEMSAAGYYLSRDGNQRMTERKEKLGKPAPPPTRSRGKTTELLLTRL
jgi:hypothetical protein